MPRITMIGTAETAYQGSCEQHSGPTFTSSYPFTVIWANNAHFKKLKLGRKSRV